MASKSVSRVQIISMYKQLLRESSKFTNYNFKNYAMRRVKDAYRENISITDPKILKVKYQFAQENLEVIRRQVVLGHMYQTDKLVIENQNQ